MSVKVFYAGGSRGPNVRGDGNGSYLKRGWYVRDSREPKSDGPYHSLAAAMIIARRLAVSVIVFAKNKRLR